MLDAVAKIVRQSPSHDYATGMYASFKRIDDTWGLKFYYHEKIRDKNYNRQKAALEIGCAPRLGEKFEMTNPDDITIYGYITEAATVYSEPNSHGWYEEDIDDPAFDALMEKLMTIMPICDMHGGNIGYLNDGRLVVIDFSHVN